MPHISIDKQVESINEHQARDGIPSFVIVVVLATAGIIRDLHRIQGICVLWTVRVT